MENRMKIYNRIAAVFIFVVLPLLVYMTGDFPRRSVLKEVLSMGTIVAFFIMLLQFYLSRANAKGLSGHKMSKVIKWHKVLGYTFVSLILLHPFFLVLPHYFEAGQEPKDALLTIITNFESTGVILGLLAYIVLFIIGITSFFRNSLPMSYKTWRVIHGILSIVFVALASFHVSVLGRHSNMYMNGLIAILSVVGIAMLLKVYVFKKEKPSYGIK